MFLSYNPNAIDLLERNIERIHWPWCSENPNALSFLEKHTDKIDLYYLSNNKNPKAMNYFMAMDLEKMRTNCKNFAKELAEYVFHPKRLNRLCAMYVMDLEDYFEQI